MTSRHVSKQICLRIASSMLAASAVRGIPKASTAMSFYAGKTKREGIKKKIFPKPFNHKMMRESLSRINDFLFSIVSIELDGFDGI